MAYNFSAIQRKSDGKYKCVCGDWRTLDFTTNYTAVRFHFGDDDDASQYASAYGEGDFRVIEYWMPGEPGGNKPFSNETVIGNFLGSFYGANRVTIDALIEGNIFSTSTTVFREDAQTAFENRQSIFLVFTESEVNTYGIEGTLRGSDLRGATMPSNYYLNIGFFDGRYYYLDGFASVDFTGESFQYEVL
jgi:hypothetical protein